MFYSDVFMDKLIDKFIADMSKSGKIKERETYLEEAEDKNFVFKKVGG